MEDQQRRQRGGSEAARQPPVADAADQQPGEPGRWQRGPQPVAPVAGAGRLDQRPEQLAGRHPARAKQGRQREGERGQQAEAGRQRQRPGIEAEAGLDPQALVEQAG